jgi:WD40 repeat protein
MKSVGVDITSDSHVVALVEGHCWKNLFAVLAARGFSVQAPAFAVLLACGSHCACAADDEEADDVDGQDPDSCLRAISTYDGNAPYTYSVDWSPVDDYVIAGTTVELRLFEVDTEAAEFELVGTLDDGRARAATVKWVPGGRLALSGGTEVKLLEITRDPPAIIQLDSYTGHVEHVYVMDISPDGTLALTGGADRSVQLLGIDPDAGTLTLRATFFGHNGHIVGISWAPDGRHAVTVSDDMTVRLLEADVESDPAELREVGIATVSGDRPAGVDWPAQWNPLITGSWDGHVVHTWTVDVEAGTLDMETQSAEYHTSGVDTLAWSRDRPLVVTGGHDDTIRLFSVADGGVLTTVSVLDHTTGAHWVSWSHDESYLVLASGLLDRISLVDARSCPGGPLE